MTSDVVGSASVTIDADFNDLDASIQRRLVAAARKAGKDAEKIFRESGSTAGKEFGDSLSRDANGRLRNARGQFAKEGDAAGKSFGDSLRRAVGLRARTSGGESGNFFAKAFQTAASKAVGQALFRGFLVGAAGLVTALSPLSTLLGGATAAVVALAAALSQAAGAGIALGGVLGSLGLAAVTVKVGFAGVGDAIKAQSKALAELNATGSVSAATQKKLDETLKGLAPSARATVLELGKMAPAWKAVQQAVQQNLFKNVSTTLRDLGSKFLPVLKTQLSSAAVTLNRTAIGLGQLLTSGRNSAQISGIFSGLNRILATLLDSVRPLAQAFLDAFGASLPFAQNLAVAISNIATKLATMLSGAVKSGAFLNFMTTATTLATTLFHLLGNVGSIIGSVFSAGTAAGGNLLILLTNLTGELATFLKSAQGKAALASFFGLIAQAGKVLVGVFQTLSPLFSGIGALLGALRPALQGLGAALTPVIAQLATGLGSALASLAPAIASLIGALGPAVGQIVSVLATAFAQLGPVVAQVVTAIGPLVTVLGTVLSGALQAILPIITTLVGGIAQLLPVVTPLVSLLGSVLVGALNQLLPIFTQLVPVIVQFAQAIGAGLQQEIAALAPLIPALVGGLVQILSAVLQLLPSLLPLVPALVQINVAFLQIVVALTPLITLIAQFISQSISNLGPAIVFIVGHLVGLATQFANIISVVARVVGAIVNFVSGVLAQVNALRAQGSSTIGAFVSVLVGKFNSLVSLVSSAVGRLVSAVLGFLRGLVTSAVSAAGKVASGIVSAISRGLSSLVSTLKNAGSNAIQGFIDGLSAGLSKVKSIAGQIAGAVTGPVAKLLDMHSPSRVMHKMGKDTIQGYINGLRENLPGVRAAITALIVAVPKGVQSAIGKVKSAVNSLGKGLSTGGKVQIAKLIATAQTGIAALGRASDAVNKKTQAAAANLKNLVDQSKQFADSVRQAIVASGTVAQGSNQSFEGIIARLTNARDAAVSFGKTLSKLAAAGLNKTALQQLAENAANPDAQKAAESILAAGKAGIAQVNKLQGDIAKAAAATAKAAADALFGQGIRVAQGIVAGLQRQQAALNAQMTKLGDTLALRVLAVLRSSKLIAKAGGLPGFSNGGVVDRPTVIAAGEGGKREVVIPLTKPQRAAQLMRATGLDKLSASAPTSTNTKTFNVPIQAGTVVDHDALVEKVRALLISFGFTPKIGIETAGGRF